MTEDKKALLPEFKGPVISWGYSGGILIYTQADGIHAWDIRKKSGVHYQMKGLQPLDSNVYYHDNTWRMAISDTTSTHVVRYRKGEIRIVKVLDVRCSRAILDLMTSIFIGMMEEGKDRSNLVYLSHKNSTTTEVVKFPTKDSLISVDMDNSMLYACTKKQFYTITLHKNHPNWNVIDIDHTSMKLWKGYILTWDKSISRVRIHGLLGFNPIYGYKLNPGEGEFDPQIRCNDQHAWFWVNPTTVRVLKYVDRYIESEDHVMDVVNDGIQVEDMMLYNRTKPMFKKGVF